MRKIIDSAYHKAEKLISENMDILHRIAEALLEYETIDAKEFEAVFRGEEIRKVEENISLKKL